MSEKNYNTITFEEKREFLKSLSVGKVVSCGARGFSSCYGCPLRETSAGGCLLISQERYSIVQDALQKLESSFKVKEL